MSHLNNIPQSWIDEIKNNPDSPFAKKAARVQQGLAIFIVNERSRTGIKSQIGTNLMIMFRDRVSAVPCSGCKTTLRKLNSMTVEEVQEKREVIIEQIERNSTQSTMAWWAKVSAYADDKLTGGAGTRFMLGLWIDEACAKETADGEVITK